MMPYSITCFPVRSYVYAADSPEPELEEGGGDRGDRAEGLTQGPLSLWATFQAPEWRPCTSPMPSCDIQATPLGFLGKTSGRRFWCTW